MKKQSIVLGAAILFTFVFAVVGLKIWINYIKELGDKRFIINELHQVEIDNEVKKLSNDSLRINFLNTIFISDQFVRVDQVRIQEKYGLDSPELRNAGIRMDTVDVKNLYRIKKYLDYYEYPDPQVFGNQAAYTPLLVFHHKGDIIDFRSYKKAINLAYRKGYISASEFLFALNRQYFRLHGKKYLKDDIAYNAENTIEQLLIILELN